MKLFHLKLFHLQSSESADCENQPTVVKNQQDVECPAYGKGLAAAKARPPGGRHGTRRHQLYTARLVALGCLESYSRAAPLCPPSPARPGHHTQIERQTQLEDQVTVVIAQNKLCSRAEWDVRMSRNGPGYMAKNQMAK